MKNSHSNQAQKIKPKQKKRFSFLKKNKKIQQLFFSAVFFSFSFGCSQLNQPQKNPNENQADFSVPGSSESSDQTEPLMIIKINVGQGDSTLIITPAKKALLIDGGNRGQGTQTILPLLESLGVDQIDYFFASHYDSDHIAGLIEVALGADQRPNTDDDFWPISILDHGQNLDEETPVYQDYQDIFFDHRQKMTAGQTLDLETNLQIECVISHGKTKSGELFPQSENEASLGLLISYGDFRYLTAGDLTGGGPSGDQVTQNLESLLIDQLNTVDVYHVHHHGSLTSSSTDFLEHIQPKAALISTGNLNFYGHPHQEILARLNQVQSQVYLTEQGSGGFIDNMQVLDGSIWILAYPDGSFWINGDKFEN